MARAKPLEERAAQARRHFQRALELSGGRDAGPYLSMAEGVAVDLQDYEAFEGFLREALAIAPDARPELRLSNALMQRRAQWLLKRSEDLFLHGPGTMIEE